MIIPDFEVLDESTQPTFNKEDARKAFALLEANPLKISKDSLPHVASFVDDNPNNPVQICDAKGNQLLLMPFADYENLMTHEVSTATTGQVGTTR